MLDRLKSNTGNSEIRDRIGAIANDGIKLGVAGIASGILLSLPALTLGGCAVAMTSTVVGYVTTPTSS